MTPIQSHANANIDLVTFDVLNAHNVQKLVQERDRLQFANLRKRHTLLHQIDRTQRPVLLALLLSTYLYYDAHTRLHYLYLHTPTSSKRDTT